MLLATIGGVPAEADAPDLYSDALSRIDSVYLRRGELVAEDLFAEAAQQLEEEIEWLMAEREGTTVTLRVGDGEVLGSVTVGGWGSLERSLRELEELTLSAGKEVDLDLRLVLLKGATNALDRHSRLLYGERLQAFDKRLKGTFFGIGARISRNDADNSIVLEKVFENNPARRAGLEDGDAILRIDGVSTVGMTVSDAVDHITGRKGTEVELVVRRMVEGHETELTFGVVRDEIREPNVEWKSLGDGFGYLRIDHFSELTEANLSRALIELDRDGALERGLVIDLRDNTGGSMMQSARSADAFVTGGDLVRTVGRDGGKVRGLSDHIWAEDAGIEPTMPIVVLQNHRTASGSEILAGSLRELDRAVLLGTRSYGKGTVQKLYPLEPGTRLKLTVAEYLLAGGLSIHDEDGVAADLPVGRVVFSEEGVEVRDDSVREGPDPLLFVEEEFGWRDGEKPPEREDLWVDLAVRVLAASQGSDRGAVLEAAGEIRELVRAEEEQRLVSTFAARGLDWSPAPEPGGEPRVRVDVRTDGPVVAGSPSQLQAEVTNLGDEPLHRVLVRLDAADSVWDRRVLPIGVLLPGQTKVGEATVEARASSAGRESSVAAQVESDGRPAAEVGSFILGYEALEQPQLALDLKLVKGEAGGEYARIEVENLSDQPLVQVHVRFEYPESTGIELAEYDAVIPALDDKETRVVHLGLDLAETDLEVLPLHVIAETPRFGEVADYAFDLGRDGTSVHVEAPVLHIDAPSSLPFGELDLAVRATDESAVDHVIVWAAGDKVAYRSGEGKRVDLSVPLEVLPGRNRYVVEAIDDMGLRTREVVYVRGVGEVAVTQPEEEP